MNEMSADRHTIYELLCNIRPFTDEKIIKDLMDELTNYHGQAKEISQPRLHRTDPQATGRNTTDAEFISLTYKLQSVIYYCI